MLLLKNKCFIFVVGWAFLPQDAGAFTPSRLLAPRSRLLGPSLGSGVPPALQVVLPPRGSTNDPSFKAAATTSVSSRDGDGDGDCSEKIPLPQIIPTKGVPIHLYTTEIAPDALEQLKVLAESPIPTDYVSAMPDVHLGKGVTIGSVFASEHYVSPNAVGVDIGCGMAAIPIDGLHKDQLSADDMNQIQQLLKEQIPTGFEQHSSALSGSQQIIDQLTAEVEPTKYLVGDLLPSPKVAQQLGTLGGGNHFLEVVHEEDTGQVWVMLHSGSRNIGNRVAQHYDEIAKLDLQKRGFDTQPLKGIHYMPIESKEGQDYLRDMEWCQRYAYQNRQVMQKTMLDIMELVTGHQANLEKSVNIHHNYCACEDCGGGRKLWVTRKGATSAKLGEMGIIPGSMGTGSYITRGKGNLQSWNSASHGAGRQLSRNKAFKQIPQEEFENSMKGVVCDTHPNVRDEAPQAYKDLSIVMKNQESLTEIVHHLLPLINVKGFKNDPTKKRPRMSEVQRQRLRESRAKEHKEKLQRKIAKTSNKLQKLNDQLNSQTFMEQANEEVINLTKAQQEQVEQRLARLKASLASMDKVN